MSDAEDDYFGTADGDDPEDDGGYGYCPHVGDYGYCQGSNCRPLDNEFGMGGDDDHAPTEPGTGKTSHFLDVITNKHAPPDLMFIFDPKATWADIVRLARKNTPVIDMTVARQQFPSLAAFQEHYTQIDVPQINSTNRRRTRMENFKTLRRTVEAMLAQMAQMATVIERFGGEPALGTVLKFEHTFDRSGVINPGNKVYTYVAIRSVNGWHVSGRPFVGRVIEWDELVDFIGDGRAWVASGWSEVPVPERAPLVIHAGPNPADSDFALAMVSSEVPRQLAVGDRYQAEPDEEPPSWVMEFTVGHRVTLSRATAPNEAGLWIWEHAEHGVLFSGPMPWEMAAVQRPVLKVSQTRQD